MMYHNATTLEGFQDPTNNLCFHNARTVLYHLANICLLVSFGAPNSKYGQVVLHIGLIIGK